MNDFLAQKEARTKGTIEQLIASLGSSPELCGDNACVYVTGSYGRLEAGTGSDLDLFIVGKSNGQKRLFTRLNEILLKANLITATRQLGIPEFSGDGQYLEHYTDTSIIEELGSPQDDVGNTFTARLLLLLESRPLVGHDLYSNVICGVIDAYWRDFGDHEENFMPAFLANDILRLWRTFCVNYEARTATEPAEEKAKRKLKNYKLKHSRLLTCYSTLIYLLAVFVQRKTVNKHDAATMTGLTPMQRVRAIPKLVEGSTLSVAPLVDKIVNQYEDFISTADKGKSKLLDEFSDPNLSKAYFESASQFGDSIHRLIQIVGENNRFGRLLTV